MDVIATEDQRMLQETTRRFLEDRSPIGALRKQADSQAGHDAETFRAGAELGWFSLFTPEAYGGIAESAEGLVDAAIIAEELGRVVYSGPFLPVNLAAFAIANAGSDAQREAHLADLSGGAKVIAWCYSGPGVASGLEPSLKITRQGADFVVDGVASYVEAADVAELLLVTGVESGGGMTQALIPAGAAGVSITPLETLDLGRKLSEVRFQGVRFGADALLGEAGAAAEAVERQIQVAVVLQAAETVGVADRALEFTLEWVQQRMAFGRPIGSFQALKHRLADHATQLEGAKAATAHAARAVQKQAVDAAIAASVAKSQAGKFGTVIIRDCLQMHGGIGMTWDHDIHFYLRRAVSNEALLGTPAKHHERLARLAGL